MPGGVASSRASPTPSSQRGTAAPALLGLGPHPLHLPRPLSLSLGSPPPRPGRRRGRSLPGTRPPGVDGGRTCPPGAPLGSGWPGSQGLPVLGCGPGRGWTPGCGPQVLKGGQSPQGAPPPRESPAPPHTRLLPRPSLSLPGSGRCPAQPPAQPPALQAVPEPLRWSEPPRATPTSWQSAPLPQAGTPPHPRAQAPAGGQANTQRPASLCWQHGPRLQPGRHLQGPPGGRGGWGLQRAIPGAPPPSGQAWGPPAGSPPGIGQCFCGATYFYGPQRGRKR